MHETPCTTLEKVGGSPCLHLLPDPACGHVAASSIDSFAIALLDDPLVDAEISAGTQAERQHLCACDVDNVIQYSETSATIVSGD